MTKIFFTILLILPTFLAVSYQKNVPPSSNRVQIEVIFDEKMNKDSLHLGYYDNYWGPDMGMDVDMKEAQRNTRTNSFYFDMKNSDRAAYFYIYKMNPKGIKIRILPFFLCEKGDEVKIHIAKDSTRFSGISLTFKGRQATKYRCQYEIENAKPKSITRSYNYSMKGGDIIVDSVYFSYMPDMLEKSLTYNRNNSEMRIKVLDKYKTVLSKFMYNVLKVDILSKEELSNYNSFNYPFTIFSRYKLPTVREQIEPKLREIFSRRHVVSFDSLGKEYLAISRLYLNVMVKKIADTLMGNTDKYREFKNSSTGLIRDRIITVYLKRYYAFKPGLADQVSDALTYVSTPYCREILFSFKSLIPGTQAFNFALPDSSNKIVKLGDFKGKVVIMDFWFTGCVGCAALNREMKPIEQYFKNNEKVVFVTVSIDRNRKEWLKSLQSGKYTHKGSIDLLADSPGYDSPIIKHYNIIGCPTLILIDPDGKIITGNPPTPPNNKEFIALIEKHIK